MINTLSKKNGSKNVHLSYRRIINFIKQIHSVGVKLKVPPDYLGAVF